MTNTNKIILVSHCILNVNSKVESFIKEFEREEARKELLKLIIENNISIIQLPCPEQIMYGSKRWGHVKDQFDTPHFRRICREEFKTYLYQIQEYINNGHEILGILGIDGSPSCGVSLTCRGEWGGELGSNKNLSRTIDSIIYTEEKGIFIEEIESMLGEKDIKLDIFGFSLDSIEKIYGRIN